ncbi:MAG: aldehyde ferredoxin oxidoreductase family protein [Spirochaetaceae bacterium]|nr:MAG: aldehyde ferredoxin oxidoreductase family protein [Spirochaetaceae bacterium]
MKAKGYFGKILRVDLSSGEIRTDELDEQAAETFIGGNGLGTKILFEETAADTDPLGPENPLIFAVGPLTGTKLFNSDRFDVVAKSPLTGIYGEASAGGYWGAKFKRCGFDALVVKGKADKPVYLYIENDKAELRDAGHLWGKETFETIDRLQDEHGETVKAVIIGPAGENQVRVANMITDGYHGRAVGRCGFGAVMGSKNLKAVAVNGSREVPVADPESFKALQKRLGPIMREGPQALREGGTSVGTEFCNEIGNMPVKNWKQGSFAEGAKKLTGMTLVETLLKDRYHCGSCVINCGRVVEAADGPYKGKLTAGTEYETVGLMGTNLLVGDLPTVLKANQLCNRYGLDTISTGSVIGFAMEAWERGLIGAKDTGGVELTWGSGPALLKMIEQIAFKKDIGAVLEGGVKRAAAKIGGEARDFALEVKGLEPPAHDPRAKMTIAVGYATSNRGACHLAAFTHDFEEGASIDDLGLPVLKDRFNTEGKAENVVVMQHLMTMFDSLVCCKFGLFGGLTVDPLIEALNAVTGWSFDRKRFFKTGERIFNLKRLYNNRLGIGAKDDVLPKRMRHEIKGGGTEDHLPPLEAMMKEYYKLRSWNPATGVPEKRKIEELGLTAYA